MRTTLDIDNDVLQIAKEIAAVRRRTAGEIISELARKGLTAPQGGEDRPYVIEDGIVRLGRRDGAVVTRDLVNLLLEEADVEDAGLPAIGSR